MLLTEEKVNRWLSDLTYNSKYEFLEEGSTELEKIANKFGIKLPNNDLAIFKCVYAFVDRANKNGCILPREEVKKSLSSLRLKAINFDHVRQRTVGVWLGGELIGDEIIAYGVFFKSNLQDDYEIIKDLMKKGNLKVSFEAWGNREHLDDGTYNLRDICFAGGALLLTSKPAFDGAEVMEIARERVLEFASVMKAPKSFIKEEAGYKCSCIKCGYETTIPDGEHCNTYDYGKGAGKCPKCGGQMRRAERPGLGQPSSSSVLILTDNDEKFFTEEELRKWAELSEKEIQDISTLPKEVTTCVRKKVKEENMSPVDAVKECWREYKKDKNKEKSTKEEDKMKIEDILKLLEEASEESILDKLEEFEGTDEELEMTLAKLVEGEDFIDDEKGEKIEEAKKLTYQERKNLPDNMFAVVVTVKNKKTNKPRKIRMFPIHDENHVRNALARLNQEAPKRSLKKLGVSIETVKKKILKRAKELNMKSLLERYKGEIEEIEKEEKAAAATGFKVKCKDCGHEFISDVRGESAKCEKCGGACETIGDQASQKEDEVEKLKAEISSLKEELKKKDEEISSLKDENTKLKERVEKAKEEGRKIGERRVKLGEFAKDLTDDELLDDVKYENAQLKKENAELKKNKDINKGSTDDDLDVGSKDKEKDIFAVQKRIRKKAWNIEE